MSTVMKRKSEVEVPTGDEFVRIVDVAKSFGHETVLRGIDLELPAGSVTAILGPSGSGKSTLLRIINHLETPDRGHVSIFGDHVAYRREGDRLIERSPREVRRRRSRIGFVFQGFNLFANLTVLDNVIEAPLSVQGRDGDEVRAEARRLLDLVGAGDKAGSYPGQLSGGQQQRIAIARALALRPRLILFDEPTSALDPETSRGVLAVMRALAREGTTMIVVTHEIGFAREVADHVVFMDDGVVVEQGPPVAVIDAPIEERTRDFLGQVFR